MITVNCHVNENTPIFVTELATCVVVNVGNVALFFEEPGDIVRLMETSLTGGRVLDKLDAMDNLNTDDEERDGEEL